MKPAVSKVIGYIGDKTVQINAIEGEAYLKKNYPGLLLHDETVVMAFKDRSGFGRDGSFFTTKRVLIMEVKGVSGKCVKYISIPYGTIKAWSVDTPGMMDPDCRLKLWSQGIGYKSIDYLTGHVDMFEIMRHFSKYCLLEENVGANAAEAAAGRPSRVPTEPLSPTARDKLLGGTPPSACDKLLGVLGDEEGMIDAGHVEHELKRNLDILTDDETVELAFKVGPHSYVLTSHRVLQIGLNGQSGKKVEYLSILWNEIKMFSMETKRSSLKDADAQLVLFTDIPGMSRIERDLKKGTTDMLAIQKCVANKVLGKGAACFSSCFPDLGSTSFGWIRDEKKIDAKQMNQYYHADPPILQDSEIVEMAFRGGRSLILLTTKRMVKIDFQEKKVNYVSIPWKSVQCFGVRSANHDPKKNPEMFISTNVNDIFGEDQPPLMPRMSFLETEIDSQKDNVDPMAIHRYLSERCLCIQGGGYLSPDVLVNHSLIKPSGSVTLPDGFSSLDSFLESPTRGTSRIAASEIEQQLKGANPMLQSDERVGLAYQVGRNMIICTNKRVLAVDVQDCAAGKVEWRSMPYDAVRGFSVESAGLLESEEELKLFTKSYWTNGSPGCVFNQGLRKGKCDIFAIQSYLAAQVLGSPPAAPVELATSSSKKGSKIEDIFLSGFGSSDQDEIPSETVNKALHSSHPILQSDEKVEKAYKFGRDLFVFTTKRVLSIDVQGWMGKKVEYTSYPLKYCQAFEVQSAGAFSAMHNSHVAIYTDIPGQERIEQDLTKFKSDIWDVHAHLASKLLR
jgi:hypothetical protein